MRDEFFDFPEMTQRSLGYHRAPLSVRERAELVAPFRELLDGTAIYYKDWGSRKRAAHRLPSWRYRTDEHQLRHTALAVARDIVRRFPTAGRVTNVNGVARHCS